MSTDATQDMFLDTDLITYAPCGCWMAIMLESADFAKNAKRIAEFVRDMERGGGGRMERIHHSAFKEVRNGVNGDLMHGCDHEPKWGGLVPTHRECPRCWKDIKVKRDGTLYAHTDYYAPCSQVPDA